MSNLAKSLFIAAYALLGTAVVGFSIWKITQGGEWLAWTGPIIATAPWLLFVAYAMLFRSVARTSERLPLLLVAAALGIAVTLPNAIALSPLALVLAIASTFFLVAYSYWYSSLGRSKSEALSVGSRLPRLDFADQDDALFGTELLVGAPALIFFFRGNWCPLCMAQIKEVAAHYRKLDELGVQVLMISPQSQRHTRALAKRFDVPFRFLRDVDGRAARRLGLFAENGLPFGMQVLGYESDTVLPTVIVLDAAGVVRWCDETDNYRVRPEPETFLPLLRELAAA